jgi:formate hydrogenlyase subunit 3/multisubunit Na+/H+ antiporter MnhD subunit
MDTDDETYRRAKARVEALKGFYTHLGIYIIINLMLFTINYLTSPGIWWFYWVTIFWGIGLFWHGASVLLHNRIFSRSWEEKKIQAYMEEEKK